jgi:hypothetical protein
MPWASGSPRPPKAERSSTVDRLGGQRLPGRGTIKGPYRRKLRAILLFIAVTGTRLSRLSLGHPQYPSIPLSLD